MNNDDFWKGKLMAFLHDPPDKCFDITKHEESAKSFISGAGFDDAEMAKELEKMLKFADHFASSADRFVFPKGKCSTEYSGYSGSSFIHPLSSTPYLVANDVNLKEQDGHLHGILKDAVGGIETNDPHATFFLYWRRWLENAVTTGKKNANYLALSPADSRIPDHTIWNHMSISSATAGCVNKDRTFAPALLLFQLGPVQEFISQARSVKDLWSGSYMLSWLIAHGMKSISDKIGPDSIIFPNLRGNGIFDSLHREDIYSSEIGNKTIWNSLLSENKERLGRWLLTPTLPNRFLVLTSQDRAEELAEEAGKAIEDELQVISKYVWEWIEKEAVDSGAVNVENWKSRWDKQVKAFPQVTWAVQPWLERSDCLKLFAALPVNQKQDDDQSTPLERLQDILDFGESWLETKDRDSRYYIGEDVNDQLNNAGIFWSAHYALVDAKLAARRNTRNFDAWDNGFSDSSVKDSLSGKEEIIGDENFWQHLQEKYNKIFKAKSHFYGAMNIIKRLWCREMDDCSAYLRKKLGISTNEFNAATNFDSVSEFASPNGYTAILAMDGDEMGKWVSGEKTPLFLDQLSQNARNYLEPILRKHGKTNIHRLLTPSYHLQLSEALSNFSTWLAAPVVKTFGGKLIYSGGDDVLAMLPSDKAIPCAEALRAVFQGLAPANHSEHHLAVLQEGFIQENIGYPLIVPGPRADVSVGIAIGHQNAPLQMLVRQAKEAEKRAKKNYQRGALACSIYKRSGEILEWGCKWDSYYGEKDHGERVALSLMKMLTEKSAVKDDASESEISGRFPYVLARLLAPYKLKGAMPDMHSIIMAEFGHAISQQAGKLDKDNKGRLYELGEKWLIQTSDKLEDFIGLFLAETFINRFRGE